MKSWAGCVLHNCWGGILYVNIIAVHLLWKFCLYKGYFSFSFFPLIQQEFSHGQVEGYKSYTNPFQMENWAGLSQLAILEDITKEDKNGMNYKKLRLMEKNNKILKCPYQCDSPEVSNIKVKCKFQNSKCIIA